MVETRAARAKRERLESAALKSNQEEEEALKSNEEEEEEVGAPSEQAGHGDTGEDRISSLPDGVLGDIITLLPTKEGVRTQILARRWRDAWCSSPLNLDCSDLVLDIFGDVHVPVAAISHILSSHSHHGPGRCFRVDADFLDVPNPADTVDAWLQSAALNNLQELEVGYCSGVLVSPPASTFRFTPTLRVFTIAHCDIPDGAIEDLHLFPLLKQLGLDEVAISDSSLHSLIARCPALDCLLVNTFCSPSLRISSPTLRSVAVQECGNEELIIESAPSLKKLIYSQWTRDVNVSILYAPKLHTLGCTSETKFVVCSAEIQVVTGGLHIDSLATVARTMKNLSITDNLSLDTVIELMSCFPCLEKLFVWGISSEQENAWRCKHKNLIKGLDIRLKTIVVNRYRGTRAEVDFVTFFVLNATVLELMTLHGFDINEEYLAKQRVQLQLKNKASRVARFNFITDYHRSFIDIGHVRDLDLIDPFV